MKATKRIRPNLGKVSQSAIRAMDRALEVAKELEQTGQFPEAIETLETVFQALNYWEDEKAVPAIHRIFDEARRLMGRLRGQMATAVMRGAHWMGGLGLGLHSQEERQEAMAEVDLQYRVGLNALNHDIFGVVWSLGFLNGIHWLAESEGAPDLAEEAAARISDLRARLVAVA